MFLRIVVVVVICLLTTVFQSDTVLKISHYDKKYQIIVRLVIVSTFNHPRIEWISRKITTHRGYVPVISICMIEEYLCI